MKLTRDNAMNKDINKLESEAYGLFNTLLAMLLAEEKDKLKIRKIVKRLAELKDEIEAKERKQ